MSSRRSLPEPSALERVLHLIADEQELEATALRDLWLTVLLRASSAALLERAGISPLALDAILGGDELESAGSSSLTCTSEGALTLERAVSAVLAQVDLPNTEVCHALGAAFEVLESFEVVLEDGRAALRGSRRRKRTGTFYTPLALAREVAARALDELDQMGKLEAPDLRICDPACGSGAFLIEIARGLVERRRARALASGRPFRATDERANLVRTVLAGVDLNPLAVRVGKLALSVFAAEDGSSFQAEAPQLYVGDALSGPGFSSRGSDPTDRQAFDWSTHFASLRQRGFDLVIGNPPWVAYAGRATQPLAPERRAFLARNYRGFRGYPTLHAAFVERALELTPNGVVALLVPSPLADLDGYRPLRQVVLETHLPSEPMLEFGQDAFSGVTQPCFALVAKAKSSEFRLQAVTPDTHFRLIERARASGQAASVDPPSVLTRLFQAERLPAKLFGELGLQTTRIVSERLLLRADAAQGAFDFPLLEGRQVTEFRVNEPRLFLHRDSELMKQSGCRLRTEEEYRGVRFLIRQTAKAPIAALHTGYAFRNSLLAGYASGEFCPEFLIGLLNSTLYRAVHLARQRDGRQVVFPQVKIGHLRSLPCPPRSSVSRWPAIAELSRNATTYGVSEELRRTLDDAVFDLFGVDSEDRVSVVGFLRSRAPELAPAPVVTPPLR